MAHLSFGLVLGFRFYSCLVLRVRGCTQVRLEGVCTADTVSTPEI